MRIDNYNYKQNYSYYIVKSKTKKYLYSRSFTKKQFYFIDIVWKLELPTTKMKLLHH